MLSVCLLAFSFSDRHVLDLRLCLGCLLGAVLCLRYCNAWYSRCSLSACLRFRTLIGTYLICAFVRACCAVLCCAVPAVLQCSRCSTATCSYMAQKGRRKQKIGKYGFAKHNKTGKDSPTSNRRRHCLGGSSERPDRCQRSPLRKKYKASLYVRHCSTAAAGASC